jgi:hypothetical protein
LRQALITPTPNRINATTHFHNNCTASTRTAPTIPTAHHCLNDRTSSTLNDRTSSTNCINANPK